MPDHEEDKLTLFSPFDMACPLDARYYGADEKFFERLKPFVSESAYITYQVRVEVALAQVLAERKIAPESLPEEIEKARTEFTVEDVYKEEAKIGHVVRALVNCIRRHVSEEARPFVHLFATSNDVTDTATALRYKDLTTSVLLPSLLDLQQQLIVIAEKHKATIQIGRTHGKYAEPITFGYFIANYVARLGNRIEFIERARRELRGKLSGAVGAHNALATMFDDPERVEADVLRKIGLRPTDTQVSTQIVHPEYLADLVHGAVSAFSVIANLADDIRHLHRSEIGETQEKYDDARVGSSTMPHKLNPKNFEFVKSMWKEFMPRMMTVYMDQISEHQRDLTNSASSRFLTEFFTAFVYSLERLRDAMKNLDVDKDAMKKNLAATQGETLAEPLYILLSAYGHPDGHAFARKLVRQARASRRSLAELIREDPEIKDFFAKKKVQLDKKQLDALRTPEDYIGSSVGRTEATCKEWSSRATKLRQALESERRGSAA